MERKTVYLQHDEIRSYLFQLNLEVLPQARMLLVCWCKRKIQNFQSRAIFRRSLLVAQEIYFATNQSNFPCSTYFPHSNHPILEKERPNHRRAIFTSNSSSYFVLLNSFEGHAQYYLTSVLATIKPRNLSNTDIS